jgi:hypothetical protein
MVCLNIYAGIKNQKHLKTMWVNKMSISQVARKILDDPFKIRIVEEADKNRRKISIDNVIDLKILINTSDDSLDFINNLR